LKKTGNLIYFLLLSLTVVWPKPSIKVSAGKIGMEDRLKVVVKIDGKAKQPLLESDAFAVVNTSRGSSMQIINGQMSYKTTFTYILSPQHTGECSFRVVIKGQDYGPYKIQVVKGSQAGARKKKSANPLQQFFKDPFFSRRQQLSSDDVFMRLIPDKQVCYTGEVVTVDTYIYTKVNIRLEGIKKATEVIGATAQTVTNLEPEVEFVTHKGKRYRRQIVKRVLCTPYLSGILKLKGGEWVVSRGFSSATVALPDVDIKVLKLPSKGRPSGFINAVGNFKLSYKYRTSRTRAHEPVTLTVSLQGAGNFKTITLPELKINNPNLIVNKAKIKNDYEVSGKIYRGRKSIDYYLIPRSKGSYKIPDLKMYYFSLKERRYKKTTAEGFILQVSKGDKPETASYSYKGAEEGRTVLNKDIRFIKTGRLRKRSLHLTTPLFIIVHIAVILFMAGAFFYYRYRHYISERYGIWSVSPYYKRAVKKIKKISGYRSREHKFRELERALLHYIAGRFSLSAGLPLKQLKGTGQAKNYRL